MRNYVLYKNSIDSPIDSFNSINEAIEYSKHINDCNCLLIKGYEDGNCITMMVYMTSKNKWMLVY